MAFFSLSLHHGFTASSRLHVLLLVCFKAAPRFFSFPLDRLRRFSYFIRVLFIFLHKSFNGFDGRLTRLNELRDKEE